MAVLADLIKDANKASDEAQKEDALAALLGAGSILGILQLKPNEWFKSDNDDDVDLKSHIDALVKERAEVRAAKNWARADEIRDELAKLKVIVKDGPEGSVWRFGE